MNSLAASLRRTAIVESIGRWLPPSLRSAVRTWIPWKGEVAVGRVRFGSLRRLTPLSREFGFDRGKPVDRYYVERFLAAHSQAVKGRVLEFGDASYTRQYGGALVTQSDVVFPTAGNPHATIVADLTADETLPEAAFDCIICTQTLHLFFDPLAVVGKLHRALRPGGVLLATVPGITQISDPQWKSNWYWSFTGYSANRIFAQVFGADNVEVEVEGNVLAAAAFLYGLAASELRSRELDHRDPDYHLLITVRATKQDRAHPAAAR